MIALGVNIDHIATIRQARRGIEPDPVHGAYIAELNGADQITVHLREDRRHIQFRDVQILRESVQTKLNLEMAPIAEMVTIAKQIKPDTVTLVPEKREEITTEGGLLITNEVKEVIGQLKEANIEVSLFIEADLDMIKLAGKYGADAVELHTGKYAEKFQEDNYEEELKRLLKGAKAIKSAGMRVVAGHGLNYKNIYPLLELDIFTEYNIGHSIISRSVFTGLAEAVNQMKRIINNKY
jgi:pyridoxine 5-phosphate synthase